MSKIKLEKPFRRWLFGGIGFHNSEITMYPIMTESFKNERAVKTFREISPTFSRVYGGFADWTREAMDNFADYYDMTFRNAGTLLYLVPGRMPMPDADFDVDAHCEKIAEKLEYLIKVRQCRKIRYFCITNELSAGNTYAYLASRLDYFSLLHEGLYRAFRRHGIDVGLLATDCSEVRNFHQIRWAAENVDEITADYCAHLYLQKYAPGDLRAYEYCRENFAEMSELARDMQKRFIVGEYGVIGQNRTSAGAPMVNDYSYAVEHPEYEGVYAVALAEISAAIVNSGALAGALWTMIDYPDPFIKEDGDTPQEKARYEVARFSGHGLQIRYNKNGLIRWCDAEGDYSSRASLYTMGYMARLFKKGTRVLSCKCEDNELRACAVTGDDGTLSVCIISWGAESKNIELELPEKPRKAMRRYDFAADNIPYSKFNDLQPYSALVEAAENVSLTVPPRSVTFLTTDYVDRTPSRVGDIRREGKKLYWSECTDAEHCYYRVYKNGVQTASTVACYADAEDADASYAVISVDRYGNAGEL